MDEVSNGAMVLIAGYFIAAFFVSVVVATNVRIKSAARGEGLLKEWTKGGLAYVLSMLGFLVLWFIGGHLFGALGE